MNVGHIGFGGAAALDAAGGSRFRRGGDLLGFLKTGRTSLFVQVYADSTSIGTGGWAYQAALALAARYPEYTHRFASWDDSAQRMKPATDLVVGSGGRRGITLTSTSGLAYAAGNFADPSGDIDGQVFVKCPKWVGAASTFILMSRSTANSNGFRFGVNTNGTLFLIGSSNGSSITINQTSSVALDFADGAAAWVRFTLDADNGSSGYDVRFYTSADGATWTQLGATRTGASAQAISWTSSGDYVVGKWAGGQPATDCTFYLVRFCDVIGGWNKFPEAIEGFSLPTSASTMVGSPTITWLNAGKASNTITYWSSTRLESSIAKGGISYVVICDGHNWGSTVSSSVTDALTDFVGDVKALRPGALIEICLQNAEVTQGALALDASFVDERRGMMAQWGRENAFSIFDAGAALAASPTWTSDYISSDGTHPSTAGYAQWGAAWAEF